MRKELLLSIARKLIIAALVVSAVLLALRTDYFSALGRTLPSAPEEGADASVEAAAALWPRAVMACYADGGRAATAWDGAAAQNALLHFAALLGEALGSAGAPEAVTEAAFRAGAEAGSVFVDLGAVCPLDLLTGWLGAGVFAARDADADVLYLGLGEDAVFLCYRSGDGGFYRCGTAAQAEALSARMSDFAPAGDASFACENPLLDGVEPYLVIPEAMPRIAPASAASARDEAAPERLLEAAGMNFYVASHYDEADGTAVYVEDERSLRLSPEGVLSYRNAAAPPGGTDTLADAVDRAFRLARGCALACGGDAAVMFAGADAAADGSYTVYFDYCLNGIPVRLPGGRAFAVEVSGGTVTRASAALRRCALSEGAETVLPTLQAAAIAASKGGGAPELVYMDTGSSLKCVWVDE